MNKTGITIIIILIIAIVIGIIWIFPPNQTGAPAWPFGTTSTPPTATPTSTVPNNPSISAPASSVKSFTIVGTNFKFSTAEIRAKRGDTVRIIFQNGGGQHNWVLDEFNAQTNILQAGEEQTIQFVADKAGQFEYYCSVGQHRQMGMRGLLIVE